MDDDNEEKTVTYLPGTEFVNVYFVDRHYGGPEEGGWWYNTGRAIKSIQVTEGTLEEVMNACEDFIAEQNKDHPYPISSVLSTGRYMVQVEDEPAADYPKEIPHYE